jgi:hypothetical protein
MMQAKSFFFASLIIAGFYSCSSSMKTFSDRDTKIDLKNYRSYAWLAPDDSVFNRKREDKTYGDYIMYTANMELQKKGMQIDTLTPDAIFVFETFMEEKEMQTQSPTVSVGVGFGGPGYYVGGAAPVAGGEIRTVPYTEGTLVFNMIDTRTGNLIWEGGAISALTMSDDIHKKIKTAIIYTFRKLPIRHKTTGKK